MTQKTEGFTVFALMLTIMSFLNVVIWGVVYSAHDGILAGAAVLGFINGLIASRYFSIKSEVVVIGGAVAGLVASVALIGAGLLANVPALLGAGLFILTLEWAWGSKTVSQLRSAARQNRKQLSNQD